jgi:hypothetical protein
MSFAAGVEPPPRDSFDDVGIIHAIDGDGTPFCTGDVHLEQVDQQTWADVPDAQRCPACALNLVAITGHTS